MTFDEYVSVLQFAYNPLLFLKEMLDADNLTPSQKTLLDEVSAGIEQLEAEIEWIQDNPHEVDYSPRFRGTLPKWKYSWDRGTRLKSP
jgi:hypothetical protein